MISTEISRLQQAKADIKEALENKGVEVAEDKKLDEYADLINNMESTESLTKYGKMVSDFTIQKDFGAYQLIEELVIPKSVTTIGNLAFNSLPYLKKVSAEEGSLLTEIRAFSNNQSLTTVDLSNATKLTKIYDNCFQNNKALTTLILPDSVTEIGGSALSGKLLISELNLKNVTNLSDYWGSELPLETVDIPKLENFPTGIFNLWSNLKSFNVGSWKEGLTKVPNSAFNNCTSLEGILVVPSTVTHIDSYAFANCKKLTAIQFLSETPPTLANIYCFNGLDSNNANVKFYVPANAVEAYKTAEYWSHFANKIEAAPEE